MSKLGIWLFALCTFGGFVEAREERASIDDRALADPSRTADWLAYGRTHSEQRFSPLADIHRKNVSGLSVSWYRDLPDDVGLVSTPLVHDGTLYFTGTMNVVRAVDARSGRLRWEYDPDVAGAIAGHKRVGWVHSRGLALYGDKLFLATWDGRLIALTLDDGKRVWEVRTYGIDEPLYITGAPKAFKGKVLIGNGGTEAGPTRGYVSAYDADTGDLAWRFHIVPGNPADGFETPAMMMAATTWTGEWWKHGGGGNAWHGFTYDPEFDRVYIGTGNGSPWNRKLRSPGGGDNLFLCSIVALDPDTGDYIWHYQTTPGETWDFNSNMDIVLADLTIERKPVKAILHAPKNGFFYVIDRADGRLISAEPFTDVNWASRVDIATGRPVERPGARYEDGFENITPSPFGGHSWHAMSFHPNLGYVFLPTLHLSADFSDSAFDESWRSVPFEGGTGVDWARGPQPRPYEGSLQAWDPVRQRAVWSVPQERAWAAGTLATGGGLVFQGDADGVFTAYDAKTGDRLWHYDAGLGISAPPITYKIDGTQYIALLVGYGGGYAGRISSGAESSGWAYGVHRRRLLTFALDGKAEVPVQPPRHFPQPLVEAGFEIDLELAEVGELVYTSRGCFACHGFGAVAAGMAPDLRASAVSMSEMEPVFRSIVRDGARNARGMPGFPDLADTDLQALRHYVRHVAHADAARASKKQNKPK